jgi:tRNA-dihydrouridine synthase 1
MVNAAKLLEEHVDAIDINFGCPQAIAKRGHYGSYLLEDPILVYNIVK